MFTPSRKRYTQAWLIGLVVGIAALSVVGRDVALFALALFTSLTGIAFAAIGVFWIAAGVVAVIDPKHAGRNAAIIAIVIVASVILYLAAASSTPPPPGASRGGANVMPRRDSPIRPNDEARPPRPQEGAKDRSVIATRG